MLSGMLRRTPKRASWANLGEYASGDVNQTQFRAARAAASSVSATITNSQAPVNNVDWAKWESTIVHKELVSSLKSFHDAQTSALTAVANENHSSAVQGYSKGWDLFSTAVSSCEQSVLQSKQIVANGARALWVSYNNPPIAQVSTSEWLDTDQYWQAFVEKHHFYHNHLASVIEDPESKEYDQKQEADLLKKWEIFDSRGVTRFNNKLLYQRPSYEYYDLFRGPLVEHMVYFLAKTGSDARVFPECMPHSWFQDIYAKRFQVQSILHRRKKARHLNSLAREQGTEFLPADIEAGGEAHFAKLITKANQLIELQTARLMGNFILFSDAYTPVQTSSALYKVLNSGAAGTWYKVPGANALFFQANGDDASKTPSPVAGVNALLDHMTLSGARLNPAYAEAMAIFAQLSEARSSFLQNDWFKAEGESTADAFLRRLAKDDPARRIYEAYAQERADAFAKKETVSADEALKLIGEVEAKFQAECEHASSMAALHCDDLAATVKADVEHVTKLSESGGLQGAIDAGAIVVLNEEGQQITDAATALAAVQDAEANRERLADAVASTKVPLK